MPESSISHTQVLDFYTNDNAHRCYRLTLTIKENSYNIEANTSSITVTGIFEVTQYFANTNGYAFSSQGSNPPVFTTRNVATGEVVQTKKLTAGKYGVKYNVCSLELPSVPHNDDGTLNVSYSITISYASTLQFGYMPKPGTVITTSGALTNIPRATDFTLSTTMSTGADIHIVRGTPAVSSYRHTLYYTLDGTVRTLYNKSNASPAVDAVISWGTIIGIIGTNVTKVLTVTLETYTSSSAATPLASISKDVMVSTGRIPFSGYDNGAGDVGVTLGAKATGPGFSVQLPTTFGTSVLHQDVDFAYANVLNWPLPIKVELVWSGSASTIEWNNGADYVLYIVCSRVTNATGSRFFTPIPTLMFGTTSTDTSGDHTFQEADEVAWVTWIPYISSDGKGHIVRKNQGGSSPSGTIIKVWGIK